MPDSRDWNRFSSLKELSLVYEGHSDEYSVHLPNISAKGMFINTSAFFPEGAVLKVRFRLARSNHPVVTRCEVRFCLPGVGVGVEFIGIAASDEEAIRKELRADGKARPARK